MNPRSYWWEDNKEKVSQSIFQIVRFLNNSQGWIREGYIRNMRLYGNMSPGSMSIGGYASQSSTVNNRLSLNVVQLMCDTVTQKIAKNRPRPMFLTEGADYEMQRKAKLLNKFIDGQFYASKIYEYNRGPATFKDSTIMGSGFMKVFRTEKEILCERVFPGDIAVDENEGIYGQPRSLFQSAYLPKQYVANMYPKFADQIMACGNAEPIYADHRKMDEYIWLLEAWHLPGSEKAKDGRHVICVENQALVDEKYDKSYFPFVKIDWNQRVLGYIGQGLSEQLTPTQIELNKTLRQIQEAFNYCTPTLLAEMSSAIPKSQFNNITGRITWYKGIKPEWYAASPVSPELFTYTENLYKKSFEVARLSQFTVTGQKPAGLNSGKALRTYNDIESEGMVLNDMMWEQFHLDAAKIMIDLAKDIAEEFPEYSVMSKSDNKLERIKWKDIDLTEDQYMMQLFPTNYLSKTPAGRLQDITELSQAGLIDKPNALRLLDFPDLEGYTKFANASLDDLNNQVSLIMDEGEYQRPEPFQDLQSGIKLFQSAYLYARTNNVPEDRQDMLRLWIEEAQSILQKAQDAQAQQQMAMQAQAQQQAQAAALPARPQQAPQNDLLPPQAAS